MNPYGHSPEPLDTREQPECCCPLEGPEHLECPAHGNVWRMLGEKLLQAFAETREPEGDIPW